MILKLSKGKSDFIYQVQNVSSQAYSYIMNITVVDTLSNENKTHEFWLNVVNNEFTIRPDSCCFESNKTNEFFVTNFEILKFIT